MKFCKPLALDGFCKFRSHRLYSSVGPVLFPSYNLQLKLNGVVAADYNASKRKTVINP